MPSGIRTRTSGIMVPAFVEPTVTPLTYYSVQTGLLFPNTNINTFQDATIDAATEKYAVIGKVFMPDRGAGGSRTISSAAGTIAYRTNTVTFANAGTTVNVGLQGVSTSAGPIAQPNGTYTVGVSLASTSVGGEGIQTTNWQTTHMSSGSATLSHGDMIAAVWEMSAVGGVDSVIIRGQSATPIAAGGTATFPITNAFVAAAWQTTNTLGAGRFPNLVLTFDDTTQAIIDGITPPVSAQLSEPFGSGTNPKERGLVFQVPWSCKIDGLWVQLSVAGATADFTLTLYSDPTGTPTQIVSQDFAAEQTGTTTSGPVISLVTPEQSLTRATDYGVAVLATGAGSVTMTGITLGDSSYRQFIAGGTTLKKITRNSTSIAFTPEASPVSIYNMGVRISQLQS